MGTLTRIVLCTALLVLGCGLPLLAQNLHPQPEPTTNQHTQKVLLTPEELAWLEANPEITIAYPGDYGPYSFQNKEGLFRGISVDLVNEVAQRVGIKLRTYPDGNWTNLYAAAQRREVDIIGGVIRRPERSQWFEFTTPYLSTSQYIVTRKEHTDIQNRNDIADKKLALVKGYATTKTLLDEFPNVKPYYVESVEAAFEAVSLGKADASLGVMGAVQHYIAERGIQNLRITALFSENITDWRISVRNDWPLLRSILDKSLASISDEERQKIFLRWTTLEVAQSEAVKSVGEDLQLTDQEHAWLAQDHLVRVRVGNYPPSYFVKDGKAYGVAIDLLREVSNKTGVRFQFLTDVPAFNQDLEGLVNHTGPDLLPSLQDSPEREKVILFTEPYSRNPRFIFTRDDAPFVAAIEDLFDHTVAVEEGFLVQQWLIEKFPNIELLSFANSKEALQAVSTGRASAYIGPIRPTAIMINKFGFSNLKAAAPSSLPDGITRMGVRNDWPELRSIIDKALASIPPEEKTAISNKWSPIKFEHGLQRETVYTWILIMSGVSAGLILVFVAWNRTLKTRVRQRTKALETEIFEREKIQKSLADSEERFRSTFEQAAVGIAHVAADGSFLRVNQKFGEIVGYANDELLTLTFQDITHPDDLNNDLEQLKAVLDGHQENYTIEKRYIRKDASIVWVNLTVAIVRKENESSGWFVSVIEDVSDRKSVEEALRTNEQKFRALMEQSPFSIVINNPDGRINRVNKAFMEMWGITDETLPEILEKYNILEDEEAMKRGVMPLIERAFTGESVVLPVIEYDTASTMDELQIKTGTSEKRWVLVRLYPIKGDNGELMNVVAVEEDVTQRKMAEQKIDDYQQRLKSLASQLALAEELERRRIAADLHDDVGQNLAFSRLKLAGAIQDCNDAGLTAQLDQVSQALLETIEVTSHLIFELSSPTISELGLGAAISEWVEDKINKNENIDFDLVDKMGEVDLDENVRTIIFRNIRELLTNTIKHARANRIQVVLETVGKEAKITVHDNGLGFNPSHIMNNISTEGGFGLFSVQERMSDLNGKLEIDSAPHQGCTIIMTCPLS